MMSEIITILVLVIMGLFGINAMRGKKIEYQKKEIKTKEAEIENKKEEMRTINEVQTKINEAKATPLPEKKDPPPAGDSDSRLERLNRLHDN